MDAVPALLALVMMLWLWRDLPRPVRAAWQLKLLFCTVCSLIFVCVSLSIAPAALSVVWSEVLVRLWYAFATLVFGALSFVCAPGLSRRPALVLMPVLAFAMAFLFSDWLVTGAQHKPALYALSGTMVTRVPGEQYHWWLWFIRAVALLQVFYLCVRIRTERDGRDRNSAQVLLYSLACTYVLTGILATEMEKPVPSFNALPVIALACLAFVLGVSYTQRQFKLMVFNTSAKRLDQRRLHTIYAACDSQLDNKQLAQLLAGDRADRPQTYLLRHGQGVPMGNLGRLAWCDELERDLNRIVARWPVVQPQNIV